jgi:hypothetical protein
MLCLWPGTQQAFFIAINADSETSDYARFDALLSHALMPAMPVPRLIPASPSAPMAWEGWYVPAPNRFGSFRFVDTVFNPVHVSHDGQSFMLTSFQAAPLTLHHAGGALFRAPGKLRASHALLLSAEGNRILTTGTQSHEQVSLAYLLALWSSLAAGVLGLAWIVMASSWRLATRRMTRRDPLLPPFAGALALLLPVPFFYGQSFMQLGDLTLASGLLAAVTTALPLAVLAGLVMSLRSGHIRRMEMIALLAVLQLYLVLAWWGLMPLRLWA